MSRLAFIWYYYISATTYKMLHFFSFKQLDGLIDQGLPFLELLSQLKRKYSFLVFLVRSLKLDFSTDSLQIISSCCVSTGCALSSSLSPLGSPTWWTPWWCPSCMSGVRSTEMRWSSSGSEFSSRLCIYPGWFSVSPSFSYWVKIHLLSNFCLTYFI